MMPVDPEPHWSADIPVRQSLANHTADRDVRASSFASLPLCAFALALLLAAPALAQNTITNVMSPVASYQYYDALGESTNMPVASSVVSYQFYDSLTDLGTNSVIASPIVSYQYYEWPGNDVLQLDSSPWVSYYYQLASGSGPLVLGGRVTDTHGAPLVGATVSAMVFLTPSAQATADGSGNYQMPSVGPGVYDLWATAAGHQASIRAVTLGAGTAQQDFQLAASPSAAAVQQTSRQPTLSYTIGPMGSELRVFDGSAFVPIVDGNNVPPADRMTVVLTHGWIPVVGGVERAEGITGWPTTTATQLRTNGVTDSIANIVAWDWRPASKGLRPPEENTQEQGVALGEALLRTFGPGYAMNVHFLGHSLGTMVNAAAANYLHGDHTANNTNVSPNPWSPELTHMTLFDHAEIASAVGPRVWWDGITAMVLPLVGTLMLANDAMQGWKPSTPVRFGWMDNYVSMFGFYHSRAVNVALQKAEDYSGGDFFQAHGYPIAWYGLSITDPTDSVLGFQRSREYVVWTGQQASAFPPSNFEPGSSYHQTPGNSDQLSLERLPWIDSYQVYLPALGAAADFVVAEVYGGTVQAVGAVSTGISDGVQQARQWVSQGFNYAGNAASHGWQAVVNWAGSSSLRLTLHTTPGAVHFNGVTPQPKGGGPGDAGTVPMVWVPVLIPSSAVVAAFDFTVAGDPVDDVIVCGIGTNSLFSLQARFVPTNGISASRLIDVSAWAGTTNEIFFGLMGGTSTNCTVEVENIRFYSLQSPSLSVQVVAENVVLTWPSTAGGYALESSPTLAGANWQTLTNAPVVSGSVYAMTNAVSGGSMFYRLRKQ